MKTATLNTLPIPKILLQAWALPPGWESVVRIHVANSDFAQGDKQPVVACLKERKWTFTAPITWVPQEHRDGGLHFCELDAATFRTILADLVVGFDSVETWDPYETHDGTPIDEARKAVA